MKKYVDYAGRGLCILLASALLVLSPVSSYISAGNMQTVEAAEVAVAGGSYLFEFLLALFGVSMASLTDVQKENAYGGYLQWVETGGDPEVYEALTGYNVGDSIAITGTMASSVRDYLVDRMGNISSGSTKYVYDGYYFDNGMIHNTYYNGAYQYLTSSYGSYYFICCPDVPASSNIYYARYDSSYSLDFENGYYVLFNSTYGNDNTYNSDNLYYVLYDNGLPISSKTLTKKKLLYNNGWRESFYNCSFRYFTTSVPFIITSVSSSLMNSASLDDIISHATLLPQQSKSLVSFGAYNSKNVEAITGQTVSGSTITAVNSAVADAVGANTTTDEDGATIYADAIGQAVAQAVQKALEESGFKVIEGGGGTETDPGEEENPDPLPYVPQIIEKIEEVGGAIKSGFNNVIDNITTTGEEIKNGIVEQIQSVLESLFVPDISAVQDSVDLITSKFEWVQDLYYLIKTTLTSFSADCQPPIIYIDFTNSETSSFVDVGRIVALDLSWYARYKATGDLLIGSFLWIFYLWRLFKKIPDVINGQGMSSESEG